MAWVFLALTVGSLVFCLLAIEGARRYLSAPTPPPVNNPPPISILKPLAGVDEGLEANLESFFHQQYPTFEILFAVSTEQDPALPVAKAIAARHPHIPTKILISGEPSYPNRKVRSIHVMLQHAHHDLIVMADSDIRVTPEFLATIAAEFTADPNLTLTTCPYRAVPGNSLWSRLEAVMMNTEFLAGILTARLLEGMRFAVGPTIACRRRALDPLNGTFESLGHYLAEDFVFGQRAAEAGQTVALSRCVIQHHIGTSNFTQNTQHRLRWVRSTRRSRPAGYIGQLFTYPIPLALIATALNPSFFPALLAAILLRGYNAHQTAIQILHDPLVKSQPWLVPLQDILSFLFYLAGFFGNTIAWRGQRFHLHPDGTFTSL
ncbi:MAG: bacteriohopanetetrol glucosamine biosynthesis glycosyltransferase HpnI [Bryobacterales bacterium]|nr:bacteriohopanetetrol glucosamine biosynthesis glycosyltransferase HpnI [Bryobacterales bacterium]